MSSLDYEKYLETLTELISVQAEAVGIAVEIVRERVKKPNEVFDAFVLRTPDTDVSPTIYPKQFYQMYMDGKTTIQEQANIMVDLLQEDRPEFLPEATLGDITPDFVRSHAFFKIMNAEMNKELAAETAYVPVNDLVLVPYLMIKSDKEGEVTCRLTRNLQQHVQMTDAEIQRICCENLEKESFKLTSLNEMFLDSIDPMFIDPDDTLEDLFPESPLYVLTNDSKIGGARAIASATAMDMVLEQLGEDFFVIPSSVHECLVIGTSFDASPEELREMCKSVNGNPDLIKKEDVLSDSIYFYDGCALKLCNTTEEYRLLREEPVKTQHIGRRM